MVNKNGGAAKHVSPPVFGRGGLNRLRDYGARMDISTLRTAPRSISTLRTAPRSKAKVQSPRRPSESRSGGLYGSAIKPAKAQARPSDHILPEERIAAVVASLESIPLSNKAIAREARVSNNILYRYSRGGARGHQATAGWLRLEAWIAAQLAGDQGDQHQH